jgi:hypothetical protein
MFTDVTMKNAFFWDMKTLIVPHNKYITSPLVCPAGYHGGDYEEFRLLGYHKTTLYPQCGH